MRKQQEEKREKKRRSGGHVRRHTERTGQTRKEKERT